MNKYRSYIARVGKASTGGGATFSSIRLSLIKSSTRLSLKEQTSFFKRLSFLINANVPLIEGLHVLHKQARSRGHKLLLQKVIDDVSNGQPLSKSFAKFPKVFSDFSVSIVKVGETSGTLSQNLAYLSDELKKNQVLKAKVVGAFIYPAVISLATLGITAFLMLYLFPKITPIFTSLHIQLPWSTRVIMAMSIFFQHWGIHFIVGVVVFLFVFSFLLKKSKTFHYFFDRMLLRLPIVGVILQYFNIASISRTLGLLLKSGVNISEALPTTADTTHNLVYKRELQKLGLAVTRGEKISLHLSQQHALFPDIFSHMVAIGERSGALSETLLYLSEMYDHEVDEFTKNLSTIMEPVLMVMMGVIVGFIAVSIITPIYGITQNLGSH